MESGDKMSQDKTSHRESESRDEGKGFPALNLPPLKLKLTEEDEIIKVWDGLRRKYVALTPEEYVRQHFVAWLHSEFNYPESLMANEVGIVNNGNHRRCDTVIYGRDAQPKIIVEYKAPDVNITQAVFDQIVRYNMVLHADYLIVSNGLQHYCCKIDYAHNTYHFLPRIPRYES